jgi:hypothetical protein
MLRFASLEAVRSAYARLSEVEAVAASHPGDRFVLTSVQSLKAHAEHLEAEWVEEWVRRWLPNARM